MEPLFEFLRDFWWLAFPAFGLLAATGNALEQGARRRHKRRLEMMHAKAELKAAQRGTAVPAASLPTIAAESATADAPRETQTTQLERLFAQHDAITARWLDYELDVAKVIAFPAMSDGRQPLTAAFLRAKRIADGLRPASAKAKLTPEQLAEYRNAVADFDVAFDLAERDARRIRDSEFSEVERKRLATAKQLLTVAIDQAATPAERQVAYRRVREELNGLISLSDEAIEVLENKVMLEIAPTGATTVQDAAPTADAAAEASPAPASGTERPSTSPPRAAEAPPKTGPWPVPARQSDTPGRVVHPKPQH